MALIMVGLALDGATRSRFATPLIMAGFAVGAVTLGISVWQIFS